MEKKYSVFICTKIDYCKKFFEKIFLNGKKRPFLAVFVGIKQIFTGKF